MKTLDFVAGLTIKQAIEHACLCVKNTKQPVLADINDIIMLFDQDTDINKATEEYRQRLEFKYEIERIRSNRQK